MPLARHDSNILNAVGVRVVSTHMPLARHDLALTKLCERMESFYSHASCEA